MGESSQNELFSLLFASGMPMDEADLIRYTSVRSRSQLESDLKELGDRLESFPIQILQDELGKWKLTLKPEYIPIVRHLNAETELAKGALDVLALVAHKEPALQSEIVNQLGSHSYEHIRSLVEQKFIEKKPEGRSYRLTLGEAFFRYFEISRKDARQLFNQDPESIGDQEF